MNIVGFFNDIKAFLNFYLFDGYLDGIGFNDPQPLSSYTQLEFYADILSLVIGCFLLYFAFKVFISIIKFFIGG